MKIIRFISSCLIIFVTFACSKDDYMQKGLPNGQTESLSVDNAEFPPLGGSRKIAFTADSEWTLQQSDPGWLSIDKTSGKAGTTVLSLSVGINGTWKDRTTILHLVSKNHDESSFDRTITVSQPCPYLRLTDRNGKVWDNIGNSKKGIITVTDGSDSYVEYDWNHCEQHGHKGLPFKIESNIDWKIELDTQDDFFKTNSGLKLNGQKLDKSISYKKDKEIQILPISQNIDLQKHKIKVRIVALNDQKQMSEIGYDVLNQYSIEVDQDFLVFLLDKSADQPYRSMSELTPSYDDAARSEINVHAEIDWKIDKNYVDHNNVKYPDWLEVTPLEAKANDVELGPDVDYTTIDIRTKKANPDTKTRSYTMRLYDSVSGAERFIDIEQKPYVFSLDAPVPSKFTIENEDNLTPEFNTRYFKLNTTGPWCFQKVPDWIQITTVETSGSPKIPGDEYSYQDGNRNYEKEYVGSATIKFHAHKQNLNFVDLNDLISIRSNFTEHNYADAEISVMQKKFLFDIKEDKKWDGTAFTLSNLSDMLSRDVSEHVILLNTSGEWNVEVLDKNTGKPTDWIVIPASSEEASNPASIIAQPRDANSDLSKDREAIIRFTSRRHKNALSAGEIQKVPSQAVVDIQAKQSAYIFNVSGSQTVDGNKSSVSVDETIKIPAYKKTPNIYTLTVKCSEANVEIASYPSWLTKLPKSNKKYAPRGEESFTKQFEFEMTPNTSFTDRTGEIVVKCYLENRDLVATKSVSISQDAFKCSMKDETQAKDEPLNAKTKTVSFDLTPEVQWSATASDGWMICSKTSGTSTGVVSFTIKPENNPTRSDREGFVTVSLDPTVLPLSHNISFSQAGYVFDSTPVSFEEFPELGSRDGVTVKYAFVVNSSGPWVAKDVPSWVVLTPNKGNGGETKVDISVAKNTLTEERSENFTIRASVLDESLSSPKDDLTKNVSVTQDKFKWAVTGSTSLEFSPVDDFKTDYSIVCSGTWAVSNSANKWVKVSKTSGKGSQSGDPETITVNTENNRSNSDRTASIKIYSNDDESKKNMIVSIKQGKFKLEADKSSISSTDPLSEAVQSFNVTSTTQNWIVKSSDIDVVKVERNGDIVNVQPQKNVTLKSRAASISLSNSDCDFETTVPFSQAAYVFSVSAKLSTFSELSPSPQSVQVSCSTGGKWRCFVKEDKEGMIKDCSGGGSGNGTVTISCNNNLTKSKRAAVICVESLDNTSLYKDITVEQSAYKFELTSATSYEQSAAEKAPVAISFNCSGSWSVSSDSDWATLSKTTGAGNGSITVTPISCNTSKDAQRTATITVKSETYAESVTITQAPYIFSVNSTLSSFSAWHPKSQTVQVACSAGGTWKCSVKEDSAGMIKNVSSNYSIGNAGNGTITISCNDNLTDSKRSAVIHVESLDDSSINQDISVEQSAYVFALTSSNSYVQSATEKTPVKISFNCSGDWTVESDSDWVKISSTKGSGNGSITVTPVSNNDSTENKRTAVVSIKSATFTKEVSITQQTAPKTD